MPVTERGTAMIKKINQLIKPKAPAKVPINKVIAETPSAVFQLALW